MSFILSYMLYLFTIHPAFGDINCQSDYQSHTEKAQAVEVSIQNLQNQFSQSCSGQRLEEHIEKLLEKEKTKGFELESSSQKTYKTKMLLWTFARREQDWIKNFHQILNEKKQQVMALISEFNSLMTQCKLSRKESNLGVGTIENLVQSFTMLAHQKNYQDHCIKVIEDIELQYREGL